MRVFGWCVWLSGLEDINIWSCEPIVQHRESNLVYIHKQTNFLLIWRRHHYRWRAENFDLCSALVVIEQWGFFNVPRLLWHEAPVYNGHFRGPVTLTPFAEHLAVELSLPVFTTLIYCDWDSNIHPSAYVATALTHCKCQA